MKTKHNIGDLVWVFDQRWPKERDMGIIIGQRPTANPQLSQYQVRFLQRSLYILWFPEGCIEKMEALNEN